MTQLSGHAPAEQDTIRRLTDWLARRFPDLTVEDVERAVHGNYHRFDDRPVRDVVPVLIEQVSRRQPVAPRTRRHGR